MVCRDQGFTLIELMIVVAVIAIVASIAIPNFLSARVRANENAAVSTLRNINTVQAQCQMTVEIDTNGNGMGEFGYLGELGALVGVRTLGGTPSADVITPPLLTVQGAEAVTFADGSTGGAVLRSGYYFSIFLPTASGGFVPEGPTGGATPANNPDATESELMWCAYAWPAGRGMSGNRVFFVNHSGDVMTSSNSIPAARYSGVARGPAPTAAFAATVTTVRMGSTVAANTLGRDGQRWVVVN